MRLTPSPACTTRPLSRTVEVPAVSGTTCETPAHGRPPEPRTGVVVETPHLILRELTLGDVERQLREYRERGFGEWATVSRLTGETVGLCGLIAWSDIDGAEELEVAYLLDRGAWGRGLGTEVAAAIRDWAALALGRDRLVSCIYPENTASIRVAEKIGMRFEKEFEYHGESMALFVWSTSRPG